MDVSTTKPEGNSKTASFFEAVSLVSITLLLIGFYLYASGSIRGSWLGLFGILMVVGIVGGIAASYHQIDKSRRIAGARKFRVTRQLVKTLIAKEVPPDVIFGLKEMIKDGDLTSESEISFTKRLEACFGNERSSEVQGVIMKYARVPDDELLRAVVRPGSNGGTAPPAPQEKAVGAVT